MIPDNAPTSGIETAFSQRSSLSSYNETGHLFSLPVSQNPSVLSSDSYLLNIDLTTDQYSTPLHPIVLIIFLLLTILLLTVLVKILDSYILLLINLIRILIFQMNVAVKNFTVLITQT